NGHGRAAAPPWVVPAASPASTAHSERRPPPTFPEDASASRPGPTLPATSGSSAEWATTPPEPRATSTSSGWIRRKPRSFCESRKRNIKRRAVRAANRLLKYERRGPQGRKGRKDSA